MNVLFVDDEVDMLEWYRDLFQVAFPKVMISCASNGKEAFEICQKLSFSLIITDQEMPEMQGGELIHALKSGTSPNRTTPIILISDWLSALSINQSDVHKLEKPVNGRALVELCTSLIQR